MSFFINEQSGIRGRYAAERGFEGLKIFRKDKALQVRHYLQNIDNTKIATLDEEGKICVWNSETDALLATVSDTYVDETHIPLIRFSESGNSLVVTDEKCIKTIYFSPDEKKSAVEVKRPVERST